MPQGLQGSFISLIDKVKLKTFLGFRLPVNKFLHASKIGTWNLKAGWQALYQQRDLECILQIFLRHNNLEKVRKKNPEMLTKPRKYSC